MTIAGLDAWDERKRVSNLRKHGVDFAIVQNFDFETALVLRDDRKNYGEERYRAYGTIKSRLHAPVSTRREGRVRVRATQGRSQTMPRAKNPRKHDVENPEWTKRDFAR